MTIGKPGGVLLFLAVAAGMAGGCGNNPKMVPNPDYQAWQGFAPGSYVTFEGVRKVADDVQPVRVTEKLISVDEHMVVLERTTRFLGSNAPGNPKIERRSELARIHPADDPRTHPGATTTELGADDVEIDGKVYTCQVQQLDVLARMDASGPVTQVCRATAWMNPAIPGAVVKIILHAKTGVHEFGVTGEVVDFQAAPIRASKDE